MNVPLFLGAVSAFCSVSLGAFGAHLLKSRFNEYQMSIFKTAVEYQFFHSMALLAIGLLISHSKAGGFWIRISTFAFALGIFLFSGSLYALAITQVRGLGAITPLGGILFLIGWGGIVGFSLRKEA